MRLRSDRKSSLKRAVLCSRSTSTLCSVAAAAFILSLPLGASARAQSAPPHTEIQFDIPSQPLADALLAFGAATGLEVFYDGALAIERRSAAVSGNLTPAEGLKGLLEGTGYVAVATADANTLTIVAEASLATPSAAASNAHLRRYEPYFAILQSRVSAALCSSDDAGSGQVIVSFWLASSGVISRAEMLNSGTSPARRDAIARAMRGLRIGAPMPPGLPQPITMVIFQPAIGEATGCPQGRGVDH